MSKVENWDRWLAEADSAEILAPKGFDDRAAQARVKALGQQLRGSLIHYEVGVGSTELYQDGTGLAEYRVTAKGKTTPFAHPLAWIILSHFGDLATVSGCEDPELLARIHATLDQFGLNHIPYEYLSGRTYNGSCKRLVGLSLANRYFALAVKFNSEKPR